MEEKHKLRPSNKLSIDDQSFNTNNYYPGNQQCIGGKSLPKGLESYKNPQIPNLVRKVTVKKTINSFHVHINISDSSTSGQANKNGSSLHMEEEKQQGKKKLKRMGKKVWVAAYKEEVERQEKEEQGMGEKRTGLLFPYSMEENDEFFEFKELSKNTSCRSNNSSKDNKAELKEENRKQNKSRVGTKINNENTKHTYDSSIQQRNENEIQAQGEEILEQGQRLEQKQQQQQNQKSKYNNIAGQQKYLIKVRKERLEQKEPNREKQKKNFSFRDKEQIKLNLQLKIEESLQYKSKLNGQNLSNFNLSRKRESRLSKFNLDKQINEGSHLIDQQKKREIEQQKEQYDIDKILQQIDKEYVSRKLVKVGEDKQKQEIKKVRALQSESNNNANLRRQNENNNDENLYSNKMKLKYKYNEQENMGSSASNEIDIKSSLTSSKIMLNRAKLINIGEFVQKKKESSSMHSSLKKQKDADKKQRRETKILKGPLLANSMKKNIKRFQVSKFIAEARRQALQEIQII